MKSDDETLSTLLSGDGEAVRRCIDDRGPNALVEGRSVLHWVATLGDLHAVQMVLDMGGNPSVRATSGETALMSVAYAGYLQVAKTLVDAGADPNVQDVDGQSALMAAAKGGHLDVVQLLIQAGADVMRADLHGRTALHWAVMEADNAEVVRCLLDSGASKEAVTRDGIRPREYAVRLGRSSSAALL